MGMMPQLTYDQMGEVDETAPVQPGKRYGNDAKAIGDNTMTMPNKPPSGEDHGNDGY